MPYRALRRGIRIASVGTLVVGSVFSTLGMAQLTEAQSALEKVSDKYGLWAAMTVGLVVFSVWMYYRESTKNRATLESLVERSIRSADYIGDSLHAVRESIKECQGSAWDSEKFAAAVENVRQRREARDAEESRSSHS